MESPLAASILLASLLANAAAEFYIQFRVNRPKTLTGKILGDDYYDHPEIRIYNCTQKDSVAWEKIIFCRRHKFGQKWPRRWRIIGFPDVSFYMVYYHFGRVPSKVYYQFSDIKLDQIPAELWIGATSLDQFPRFNPTTTREMLQFFETKTRDWVAVVGDKTTHENLVRYLAAPDLTWASDPNLTASYLKAFVPYLAQVILDYDTYINNRDRRLYNSPLNVRPKREVVKRRLCKMIPTLMSKMIDPCMLTKVEDSTSDLEAILNEKQTGSTQNMLCSLYCRFLDRVRELYMMVEYPSWLVGYVLRLRSNIKKTRLGKCKSGGCICIWYPLYMNKLVPTTITFPLRDQVHLFILRAYNETHRCNPEL